MASGPLKGLKVLEFTGIGPGPYCTMLLSDLGAEVLRIDRPGAGAQPTEVIARGRSSLELDLKSPAAIEVCLSLIEQADILIEGYRPGVMERLGLGPDAALARNPRLVYGRMTGWGQSGPLAHTAGHDINYIAITGALESIGPAEGPPIPPLNLIGDFGGGSLFLAFGVMAALHEAQKSGQGQVVDAAMVDGVASLMAQAAWMRAIDAFGPRGTNMLDGSRPYYRCYRCADDRYVSVGPIEPHFYRLMMAKLGKEEADVPPQNSPEAAAFLEATFKTRSRDGWAAMFEGSDACVSPVLSFDEAAEHPHNRERSVFVTEYGVLQPAPAPRFSRTPGVVQGPPPKAGEGGRAVALSWGLSSDVLEGATARQAA